MALIIESSCINCDICEPECPNKAIALGENIYEINPEKCTECIGHYDQAQCLIVCPIDCIKKDQNNIEDEQTLYEKFLIIHG